MTIPRHGNRGEKIITYRVYYYDAINKAIARLLKIIYVASHLCSETFQKKYIYNILN